MSKTEYSTKIDPLQKHTSFTEEHMKFAFEETSRRYVQWRKRLLRAGGTAPDVTDFQPYRVGDFHYNIVGINYMLERMEELKKKVQYMEQSICSPKQADTLIERLSKAGISVESLDEKINSTIT